MWRFVPKNYDSRTGLIFCYHLEKTAAESHRMLVKAYSTMSMLLVNHSALSGLKNSKSGDFDVRKEERGKSSKKFELQALLDEDDAQTLKPGETVDTERYRQQMMDLNQASRVKNDQNIKRGNTK